MRFNIINNEIILMKSLYLFDLEIWKFLKSEITLTTQGAYERQLV